ncbi:hypothetical protein MATL_G00081360 [Megalops atlanticus]|uniref:RING-type domain-containing protein n=1 Tax=Megalops atlanticus TaxID=7932 RepID=A0A9D3Q4L3_MEGAT|nr:hypothetical protein MATL_G00081360 [Megalops atlanticus]
MVLRCRKCRKRVLDAVCLLPINAADENTSECKIWHLDFDLLPAWILTSINQASWTVGKLNCQFCGARLGGFNFISRAKCPCGRDLTVHLCRSRLDRDAGPALSVSRAASGTETGGGAEFGPRTKAVRPEARSCETHGGAADRGEPPAAPPTPPQSAEVVGRKAGGLDRRAAGEAGSSVGFCDGAVQSGAGRGQDSAPPPQPCGQTDLGLAQPEPLRPAEGQRELGHWPGLLPVTPIQEVGILRRRHPSQTNTEEGEELEEEREELEEEREELGEEREELEEEREGWGAPAGSLSLAGPSLRPATELTLTKRERNRLKSQRRKQRRRERWVQRQLQEHSQTLPCVGRLAPGLLSAWLGAYPLSDWGREWIQSSSPGLMTNSCVRGSADVPSVTAIRSLMPLSFTCTAPRPAMYLSVSGSVTGSEDEEVPEGEREGFTCAVCLDVYFSPHVCQPCQHVFCEPCLRTLAKNRPANTPCPLCRTLITHVVFHKELHHTAKTFFPKLYVTRKQSFQRAHCARWPLPSCRKVFHFFSGFRRRAGLGRRPLLHGEHRLDALDLEDESQGWRLDLDVWIIYTHCANRVLGVAVCCFLCYLLLAWL